MKPLQHADEPLPTPRFFPMRGRPRDRFRMPARAPRPPPAIRRKAGCGLDLQGDWPATLRTGFANAR